MLFISGNGRFVFRLTGIFVVGVAVVAIMVNTLVLFSADHLDALAIAEDKAVNPFTIPGEPSMFSPDVLYQIHVDNPSDIVADALVAFTFSEPGPDQVRTFTVTGLGDTIT